MPIGPGSRLGPYEVTGLIGEGGMGKVWRAHHTALKRDDALKVLPDAFASDPERLARFRREAQVLASLNHPNIAHVYGLEQSDGVQALVMELVEGPTLADRIAQGPIPVDEALPIAKQIAEALEAAHERGIIHRDLKPANIKLRPDGTVKVLDFGLAKALDPAVTAVGTSNSPTITSPAMMTGVGVLLGTAAYMSPEQARGKPVDKRSDVWAFGCVLYEMLTGKRAFPGEDVTDTLAAVVKLEPQWDAVGADVPPRVLRVLRVCLQKDPGQRVQAVGDVRLGLEGAFETAVPPVTQSVALAQPLWRRALPFAIAMLVSGVLTGISVWTFRPSPPPLTITRFPFTLPAGQTFTNPGRQLVAISPDGTQMVYVANLRLYVRSMSDPEARPIPGTENTGGGVLNPVFSPDGQSIAFWSGADRTLKRIAISGGAAVTICPADNPFGMSWASDTILFGQGPKGIMRVSANGGKPELLVSVNDDQMAHGPQMLPDGQTVLFTLATGMDADAWDKAQIVVQSLESKERKVLIEGGSDARYVPTGHLVYGLGGVLFAVPVDLTRLEVTGRPVPIVEGVRRAIGPLNAPGGTGTAQFSISESGSLIYVPGPASRAVGQLDVALIDRNGMIEPLKLPVGTYQVPRISPDGKQVAFGSDDGKESIVWIYDLAGTSSMRRLTFGGKNRFPIWSADGERVAFQSDREGDLGIFWQRADGTGTAERLTRPDQGTSHVPESWFPTGDRFLYDVVTKDTDFSLWTFSLQDKKPTLFSGVQSSIPSNAAFSPDGRWVAYVSDETGGVEVHVQPFPATGAKYQVTRNRTSYHPMWSRDGTELFYRPTAGQLAVVSVTRQPNISFGNPVVFPRPFVNPGQLSVRNYDIMPDGKRFVGVVETGQNESGAIVPQIQVVLNWFEELKRRVPTN